MKKSLLSMISLILLFVIGMMPMAWGQVLTYDSFDYTSGELLSAQTTWETMTTADVSEPVIVSGNLTYAGLKPSLGNKFSFDGTGTDIATEFEKQELMGTKVYFSVLVSVTDMSAITDVVGTHFAGLRRYSTTWGGGLYFKWDGVESSNKFHLGTGVRTTSATEPEYTDDTFDANTTILVVGAYEMVDGAGNDTMRMWINPSAADFENETEPTEDLKAVGGFSDDLLTIASFYVRQDSDGETPFMEMDELRVGLSWADVTPANELIAYESFDFTAGELASVQEGWETYSTAGNTEPLIGTGSLIYPGLASAAGNKVTFDADGTDIGMRFTSQSTIGDTVFYSTVLQVTDMSAITNLNGTHFFGFGKDYSNIGAGLYVKWDGVEGSNKFHLGASVRSTNASLDGGYVAFTTETYDINTPVFVVVSYEMIDGELNDIVNLWVNPSIDDFEITNAPAATVTAYGGASTDLSSLTRFYLRQDSGSETPFMEMDEIRAGKNWSNVTPKSESVSFNPENGAVGVALDVVPTIAFVTPIQQTGGAAIENTDLASLLALKVGDATGADIAFTATIDDAKQIITITPDAELDFATDYYIELGAVENNDGSAQAESNSTFTTRAATTTTALTDLTVDGVTVESFSSTDLDYDYVLAFEASETLPLGFTLEDENATAVINDAASVPGTSTVVVTAEDGETEATYSVNFTAAATASTDATLADLQVDGVTIDGFATDTYEYLVVLPFGTDIVPVITATATSGVADITITQASSTTDMAFIEIVAQDGVTELAYVIIFSVDTYIYKVGFKTSGSEELPFDEWTTDNTYVSSNMPTGISSHDDFDGVNALKFICPKSSSGSESGWLKTSEYPNSGTLSFWLYVDASDGTEELFIHKIAGDSDSVLVAALSTSDMASEGWKEFTYEINEGYNTAIRLTSNITTDADTRIWIDDLSLTGRQSGVGFSDMIMEGPAANLFPNPVRNQLFIDVRQADYKTVDIYNAVGARVLSQEIQNSKLSIDVQNLTNGIYFVHFKSENLYYRTKFIKL